MSAGHKVFLVEDNIEVSRMYERAFRLHGHEIELAHDGETAIARLTRKDAEVPEAIIMDAILPHKNGLEVLAALRKDPRFKDVPVAVLTNSLRKEDERLFLELGADLYLIKMDHQSKYIVEKIEELIHSKNA